MADTFEQVWKPARLNFSNVPALLVRDWAQDAFLAACDIRGWSFLRAESSLNTLASRSLTATFTQNSTALTSAALFVASDAGRQIKVDTYPFYTIASVTDASNAILDMPYAATGGALTATILDAYAVCPADFGRFVLVLDTTYQRPIPFWLSQDALAVSDPIRRTTDNNARYLVANSFSTATATLGQVRYEYWPAVTAARQYPFLYIKKVARFADTTALPGVFSNRADLLKLGTRVQAAQWPGTVDQKNPYYNLVLADRLQKEYEFKLAQLSNADDNQYPEDLWQIDWAVRYGGLAPTTQLLRQTDATINDYY